MTTTSIEKTTMTVALAGNPNSGKTTLFNAITGARQKVGNYPGVTVEKKEGTYSGEAGTLNIVDLPGTYSLTPYSEEEMVARDVLLSGEVSAVIDIADASNLERNLYLTMQLLEMNRPLVLALNMSDIARARGLSIDTGKLAENLGVPVVQTVGHRGEGLRELMKAAAAASKIARHARPPVDYGKDLEEHIGKLASMVGEMPICKGTRGISARWAAIKLLENDSAVSRLASPEVLSHLQKSTEEIKAALGESPENAIATRRYDAIAAICRQTVRSTAVSASTVSDRIDAVVLNRWLGIPIFLGLMYLVFQLTFTIGTPPMDWIEAGFSRLADFIRGFWPKGSDSALLSLLVDGIIGGVGGVLVFLPNILLLFLAIALLEDSGYMARAAFIMDRMMHKIGLHGKSFIPMLVGFGCSVPAIMATRTLENRRDRIATMMVVPLMSCGARLPIYALIIPAFFPSVWQAPVLWGIYVTGIALAILSAKLLRSTVLRGDPVPFVMELSPYHRPTLRGVVMHMWERGWMYIKKAGTLILGVSILLWLLTSYPKKEIFSKDYDALAGQARQEFLLAAEKTNPSMAIGKLIAQAVAAELDAAEKQEKFRANEPGFAEAENEKRAAFSAIFGAEGGEAVKKLLEERDMLKETRTEGGGSASTPETAEHSPAKELLSAESAYEDTLSELNNEKASEELAYSYAGRVGHAMEPLIKPLGFDWKIGTSMIGAFAAKEVFVAQMGIVYSVGEADEESSALRDKLKAQYSPLVALCIMLFCLISAPCMATIAVTKKETGSWKWALFQLSGLTVLAYIVTLAVYQFGSLAGLGG